MTEPGGIKSWQCARPRDGEARFPGALKTRSRSPSRVLQKNDARLRRITRRSNRPTICSSRFFPLSFSTSVLLSFRLNEERFQQAGPLLDTASLCVACFNDAFAPDRDAQEGLLNLVSIAGHRRAVDIHNMLVDWLEEEAEAWIDGAAEVSGKERSSKKVTGKRRTYIRRSSTLRNFEPFLLEE